MIFRNELRVESFNGKDLESVLSALYNLGNDDCDFNGANGEEYLWDKAKELHYKSNLDYTLDMFRRYNPEYGGNYVYIVDKFLQEWLGQDSYYIDPLWKLKEVGDQVVLAVTWVTEGN